MTTIARQVADLAEKLQIECTEKARTIRDLEIRIRDLKDCARTPKTMSNDGLATFCRRAAAALNCRSRNSSLAAHRLIEAAVWLQDPLP